jgi:hypothetical protein
MRFRPCVDISRVGLIGSDLALPQTAMRVGPLRDDMRIPAGLVGQEPRFDVGRDELALFVSARRSDDRAERVGTPVAQRIVRCAIAGRRRRSGVIRRRRRSRLEVLVLVKC